MLEEKKKFHTTLLHNILYYYQLQQMKMNSPLHPQPLYTPMNTQLLHTPPYTRPPLHLPANILTPSLHHSFHSRKTTKVTCQPSNTIAAISLTRYLMTLNRRLVNLFGRFSERVLSLFTIIRFRRKFI